MESFGAPQETMDEAIKEVMATDQFSLSTILNGILKAFIFFAVYGLIVSAIVKRKKETIESAE
jgi:uncharacterized membrane protein